MASASAWRSSTSQPLASATWTSARRSSSRLRRARCSRGEPEAVAAVVAHRQGQQERRAAELVDRAHHGGEVVGAAGGDLRGAHRAAPHRPAGLEPAVGGGAGAVAVLDHPERHSGFGVHRCARSTGSARAALMRRSWARRCHRFARRSCAPATCSADLGWACPRRRRLPGRVADRRVVAPLPRAGRASSGTTSASARAGAGAPAVPGPCGPGPLPLLSSTRGARPARGPGQATQHRPTTRGEPDDCPARAGARSSRPRRGAAQGRAATRRTMEPPSPVRACRRRASLNGRPSPARAANHLDRRPAATLGTEGGRSRSFASSLAGEPPTAEGPQARWSRDGLHPERPPPPRGPSSRGWWSGCGSW